VIAENLKNAVIINVVLAVFNLFPIPRWTAGASPSACSRAPLLLGLPGWSLTEC
jgi:hypothetical protein